MHFQIILVINPSNFIYSLFRQFLGRKTEKYRLPLYTFIYVHIHVLSFYQTENLDKGVRITYFT